MENELATQQSPMQMIQVAFDAAIKQGSAMEVVTAIIEQQRWIMQHNEEHEFNEAMQRIQAQLKVVVKDAVIPGKGKYASSKAIDKVIRKLCLEEKVTLSYDTEDSGSPDWLRLVCDASRGPFKKRYTLPLPVDGSGAKGGGVMNKTDATLAAVTKGKRYLKNMIFDLRIEESDEEQDEDALPEATTKAALAMLSAETAADLDALYRPAYKAAFLSGDAKSGKVLMEAKRKREAELGGAQ